jgi:putative redox protein
MAELTVQLRQKGMSASEGRAREHSVTVDRPKDKDGTDQGPMGGELFLMGLGGCYMSNLLAAIRARESVIKDVSLEVRATVEGTPARFRSFLLLVSAPGADRAELEKLALIADRGCIVANSVRDHIPVAVRVNIDEVR